MIEIDFTGHRCPYCSKVYSGENRKGEAVFVCDDCNAQGGRRSMDTIRIAETMEIIRA